MRTSCLMAMLLAHLGGENGPQGLKDHLFGVAHRTCLSADKLDLGLAGELIGLLHDLGKASQEFQNYLLSFDPASGLTAQHESRGKIDHSTAGAQCLQAGLAPGSELAKLRGMVARVLGLCIVSHHSGLIDCLKPDGNDGLQARLGREDSRTRFAEAWATVDADVRLRAEELMRDPELLQQCNRKFSALMKGSQTSGDKDVQLGLLVRILFSCLIDADRTDTADHEKPLNAAHRQNRNYLNWEILLSRLNDGAKGLPTDGEVNRLRGRISSECFDAAARAKGIYTLTVPTGGGKTLAALRFALEHARVRQMERIVFVSPYISIVDQNAAVARKYLEPEGTLYASVVLEHHSDIGREREGAWDAASWRRRVLAENWDAPVVFTTMVQVLEALFGAGTRGVRRLHALCNSVLVFDEVQTLPVSMVHLFNNAINLLSAHCGSTVLLCTATQPLLQCVDPNRGAAQLSKTSELIADVKSLFQDLRRYTVFDCTDRPEGWTQRQAAALVCSEAESYGSCLLVVNTKRDAAEIFQLCRERLTDADCVVHLSTGMCPAHRTEVLSRLKELLEPQSAKPVVCVSTQLIEAGVDIDFASVVRDLAGLDSLAQAAGRCNRHGKRLQPGRVHIIELPEPPKRLVEIIKGRSIARELLGAWRREHPGQPFPLDSPQAMDRYYERSFFRRKDEMVFQVKASSEAGRDTSLLDLLGRNAIVLAEASRIGVQPERGYLMQSFMTASKAFALIEATEGVVVPFRDKGKEIVSDLNSTRDLALEWQLLRKAQAYTISVYPWQFKRLLEQEVVYPVGSDTGVYCLRPEYYDRDFGLRTKAGALEDLCV